MTDSFPNGFNLNNATVVITIIFTFWLLSIIILMVIFKRLLSGILSMNKELKCQIEKNNIVISDLIHSQNIEAKQQDKNKIQQQKQQNQFLGRMKIISNTITQKYENILSKFESSKVCLMNRLNELQNKNCKDKNLIYKEQMKILKNTFKTNGDNNKLLNILIAKSGNFERIKNNKEQIHQLKNIISHMNDKKLNNNELQKLQNSLNIQYKKLNKIINNSNGKKIEGIIIKNNKQLNKLLDVINNKKENKNNEQYIKELHNILNKISKKLNDMTNVINGNKLKYNNDTKLNSIIEQSLQELEKGNNTHKGIEFGIVFEDLINHQKEIKNIIMQQQQILMSNIWNIHSFMETIHEQIIEVHNHINDVNSNNINKIITLQQFHGKNTSIIKEQTSQIFQRLNVLGIDIKLGKIKKETEQDETIKLEKLTRGITIEELQTESDTD